jgi:hypothetical protein
MFIYIGGGELLRGSTRDNNLKQKYKHLLNKDDPIDKLILKLAKKGKLSVGVVQVKDGHEDNSDDYSYKKPIENI